MTTRPDLPPARPPWYLIAPGVPADRPGGLLRRLEGARKNALLYLPSHPQVTQSLNDFHAALSTILTTRPAIRFEIYEDAFFLDNRILLEESLLASALLGELIAHRVGSMEFVRGASLDEVTRFVQLLAAAGGQSDLGEAVTGAALPSIKIGPPRKLRADDQDVLAIPPRELYRIGLLTMDALNYQAAQGAPLNLRNARLLVNSMVKVILHDHHALLGVAALYQHDEDTCHHSVHVAILSLMLGFRVGLDEPALAALGTAGLLHDIGKTRLPRSLLAKPGPLSATERSVIERHTVIGAAMVQHLRGLAHAAMLVALEHHLNYDRSGHPRLPWTKQQHLFSRIVAIGDFFDGSVSARRTSRRPLLPEQAMRTIVTGAGTRFDPALAKLFLHTLGGYPVGSVVRLSSGEVAIVYRPTEGHPLRPQLKVVRDPQGAAMEPLPVDLAQDPRRIMHALYPGRAGIDLAAYL